ncbi:MAG: T9SS type A sorting domain-containing protein [Bacteroidetes bacterium]|nr:T9SS type A sorting domain-containing protein [Bacteroidota bacterium]
MRIYDAKGRILFQQEYFNDESYDASSLAEGTYILRYSVARGYIALPRPELPRHAFLHCPGLHCPGLHCPGVHCPGVHCPGLHCPGLQAGATGKNLISLL